MRVAVAQLNPKVGDIDGNLQKILRFIQSARNQAAELIVFPELATIGYPPRDLLFDSSVFQRQNEAIEKIREGAKDCTVILGCLQRDSVGLRNSALILEDQKTKGLYFKQLLPDYGVFDESRYFEAGKQPSILTVRGSAIGVTICEDIWNWPSFRSRPYQWQPLDAYRGKGLKLLINLSSSPFHLGRDRERTELLQRTGAYVDCPVVYCNQVGANEELVFDGCSQVVTSEKILARAEAFEEALLVCDPNSNNGRCSVWPSADEQWLCEAIVVGVRDFFDKNGGRTALVGLSGGIDSAVVAAVAVQALGSKNVVGILMPSPVTSSRSREDALALALNLGIKTFEVPIDECLRCAQGSIGVAIGQSLSDLASENLHPRLRMAVLMTIANQMGAFVLNTSNKSEIATGYSTQYGDTAGALSPIGDLVKREVHAAARYLNRTRELIPACVFDRAPTAELRPNQTDEDRLPPYAILDPMVKAVVEEGRSFESLKEFHPKWVGVFRELYRSSEFKRRQFPPIIRVTKRAFGMGRRIPLSAQIV